MTLSILQAYILISGLTVLSFAFGFFWGYIKGGSDEISNCEEEIKELEHELEEFRND